MTCVRSSDGGVKVNNGCVASRILHHASAETSESQPASTRPGGVEWTWEGNLDVVPGMLNCLPFNSTSGPTETAPSNGAGDGVEEAGSTGSSTAWAATLLLLVLALLSRRLASVLGGRFGIPGNRAFASLNLVGSGELITTTSCRHSESRRRGMMRPCVTDETWRGREKKVREENERTGRRRGGNKEWMDNGIPAS